MPDEVKMTLEDAQPVYLSPRQVVMLKKLDTPKTLKELSLEFNKSIVTIRRDIYELQEKQLIIESPFRQGKEKVYLSKFSKDPQFTHDEETNTFVADIMGLSEKDFSVALNLPFRGNTINGNEAVHAMATTPRGNFTPRLFAASVAHLVVRDAMRKSGADANSLPLPDEQVIFSHLKNYRDWWKAMLELFDSLLVMSQLWDGEASRLLKREKHFLEFTNLLEHWSVLEDLKGSDFVNEVERVAREAKARVKEEEILEEFKDVSDLTEEE